MDTHTPTRRKALSFFSLLQISDPLFPIGGYTQSYGLETYVQKGIVHDAPTSKEYLETFLKHNFIYNDLLSARLSWQYTDEGKLKRIIETDNFISAAKAPRELRSASEKLGIRFIKIVERALAGDAFLEAYVQAVRGSKCPGNYSVIFGLSSRLFEIELKDALSALIYNTASSIISNCAKLVPISQKDGQDILFEAQVLFDEVLNKAMDLKEESLGTCCAGFDLRSMQHERLYTRIYIS